MSEKMPESLITESAHNFSDDEYFDGNDLKSHSAQNRGSTGYERAQETEGEDRTTEASELFEDYYQEQLRHSGGDKAYAQEALGEFKKNYLIGQEHATKGAQVQESASVQEQMRGVAVDVVARYDAKVGRVEDAKDAIEDALEGTRTPAERIAPQEQPLPRPGSESAEAPAKKLGLFERRRMDGSKKLMNQLANAASELSSSPHLTEQERAHYKETAKRYSDAVTGLVMGSRGPLSRAELKGNGGNLQKIQDKILITKEKSGAGLTKDEKKRLKKLR